MRRVWIGVAVVAGLLGTFAALTWTFQRSLIYLPAGGPLPPAADVLPGGRDGTLHTSDGLELGAWYFPAHGSDEAAAAAPVVLFAPGNGGNRAGRAPLAEALTANGLSVLLLEYRGYGDNPGSPSEEGLALDVRAAHDYLTNELGVDRQRLVYFGESLGCGVVSELATERPPAAMLLRSPFVDLAEAGKVHYPFLPVRALLRDRFPVAENVAALDGVPMTVVYGSRDSIVPADQSREVADRAGAEQIVIAGADHNDPALLYGDQLIAATLALVERALPSDG